MRRGEKSEGVKTLQRALKELNYPLPISFAKTGDADGIFGPETYGVLHRFQVDHKLEYQDGIAGHETLAALDQIFIGLQQPTCNIKYADGTFGAKERSAFIRNNFSEKDRPDAKF
jgi:peptidoglycan hydrolase-like protein with peptidoglycan-binding domain